MLSSAIWLFLTRILNAIGEWLITNFGRHGWVSQDAALHPEVQARLQADPVINGNRYILAAFNIIGIATGILEVAGAIGESVYADMMQAIRRIYRPSLLPPETVLAAAFRVPALAARAADILARQGYSPDQIAGLQALAEQLLVPSELMPVARRFAFDTAPGGIVDRLGLESEWPQVRDFVVPLGTKLGYKEETLKLLWRAHWTVPSPEQGFQMLWRGIIQQQDLDAMLREAGYAEKWRDALKRINYRVIARVDIRRIHLQMHKSREWLIEQYTKYGYSPEDAGTLADWTINYNANHNPDAPVKHMQLTADAVLAAYRDGYYGRQEAQDALTGVGWQIADVTTLLHHADVTHSLHLASLRRTGIQAEFMNGHITEDQAYELLLQAGVEPDEADTLVYVWSSQFYTKGDRLADTEIKAAWKAGILTDTDADDELRRKGVTPRAASIKLQLWSIESGPSEQSTEYEVAQAERLRGRSRARIPRPDISGGTDTVGETPADGGGATDLDIGLTTGGA